MISPDESVSECLVVISSTRVRHLPFIKDEKLVGFISIGEVVKSSLEDEDHQMQNMEKFHFWIWIRTIITISPYSIDLNYLAIWFLELWYHSILQKILVVYMIKSFNAIQRKSIILLILLFSFLVGCTAPTPLPVPTQDQALIVAAVVKTINAQHTQDALLNPTSTLLPTETKIPPTPTAIPSTRTPTITQPPTETATTQPAYSAALVYVTAYPENKREYVGNERFGIALGFQNTGTLVWQAGTNVKLISYTGEVTVQLETAIDHSVLPGEKVEFDLWAFGSEWYGDHTFFFQLYNDQGLAITGGYATFTYTSV